MGRPDRRRIVVVLGLLAVVLGLLGIGLAYRIGGLEAASAVAGLLGVPAVVVPFVRWLLRWGRREATLVPAAVAATNHDADDLAEKVREHWQSDQRLPDLDRPSPIPVPWRLTTRDGAMQSAELVGVKSFDGSSGQVEELVAQFKVLPRPRLVVLGGSGAGKSTLALQLLLELLDSRKDGEPVPVLVPVSGWDPAVSSLRKWLPTRLAEVYPSLRGSGAIRTLVNRGHVLPLLDGLDESPAASRAALITALNGSLTEDDQFILTSRTDEFVEAVRAAGHPLNKTVVIEPGQVTLKVAARYLEERLPRTERPWQEFLDYLNGEGADDAELAEALGAPLDLWLLSTTYPPDGDPRELLDRGAFPTAAALRGHLFDLLVPQKLKEGADGLRFLRAKRRRDPAKVRAWLELVAALTADMRPAGVVRVKGGLGTRTVRAEAAADWWPNRDFRWWQLPAVDLPDSVLSRVYWWGGAAIGIATGALAGPVLSSATGQEPYEAVVGSAMFFGILGFLAGAVAFLVRGGLDDQLPPLYVDLRSGRQIGRLVLFVLGGLLGGALVGAVVGGPLVTLVAVAWERLFGTVPVAYSGGVAANAVRWGIFAAVIGAAGFCALAVDNPLPDGPAATPDASWRGARAATVIRGAAFALAGTAFGGLVYASSDGSSDLGMGLTLWGLIGLLIGVFSSSRAWALAAVTTAYLAWHRELPLRLMAFLHDAHRLELLRTIGSVYQFRHAAFQDHLVAAQEARVREVVASLSGSSPRRGSGVFMASALVGALVASLVGLVFTATTTAERVQNAVVAGLALLGLIWVAVRRHRRGESLVPATWLATLRRRSTEPPPR